MIGIDVVVVVRQQLLSLPNRPQSADTFRQSKSGVVHPTILHVSSGVNFGSAVHLEGR